jgi:hypothetical protein
MEHFHGGMDNWDPAITDGFAMGRPVILCSNSGFASSSGRLSEVNSEIKMTGASLRRTITFFVRWADAPKSH